LGYAYNVTVSNCYSLVKMQLQKDFAARMGGIVAYANASDARAVKLENCYFAGALTDNRKEQGATQAQTAYLGAVASIFNGTNALLSNCHYLSGSAPQALGQHTNYSTPQSATAFPQADLTNGNLLTQLGAAFIQGTNHPEISDDTTSALQTLHPSPLTLHPLKLLRHGQLYILHNGILYTLQGAPITNHQSPMIYQFQAYYRPMLWGCEKWILSAYPNMESTVINGPYEGCTLTQLLTEQGEQILGRRLWQRYGTSFPLLFKFIESNDPLSIQVHPSDALAQKRGKGQVGKTEMWYVLPCEKNAYLLSGLKNPLTPETYKAHVADHSIVDDLARYELKEGDCFFLPAGRIHAIGSGCHLLEIQQSSDLTYRIYDYDRRDAQGNPRELHTELAAEAIDYTVLKDYRTPYLLTENTPSTLVECPYFLTQLTKVTDHADIDWTQQNRFLVLVVTKGQGTLIVDGDSLSIHPGDTLLLPASTQHLSVIGSVTFIQVTVP